jgi:hypothetical protein
VWAGKQLFCQIIKSASLSCAIMLKSQFQPRDVQRVALGEIVGLFCAHVSYANFREQAGDRAPFWLFSYPHDSAKGYQRGTFQVARYLLGAGHLVGQPWLGLDQLGEIIRGQG